MKTSLLMDLYELTMVAGYHRREMHEKMAVFDLYFRNNPFNGGYAVFAGLEPALDYLEDLRFDEEDLRYLSGLGLFEDRFLSWLRSFRFRGTVTTVDEGEVIFGGEPILSVEGALGEAQLVETALLNIVNFQTLVATKTARIVREAGEGAADAEVSEFGARRAQGPDGALAASRAACVGGARSTSHLRAGQAYAIPVSGTQAHSWVMSFPTELEAFRAYAEAFPDRCVLLVDTYDTLRSGVPHAIEVAKELQAAGHRLAGIRLDSGDLAYLSKESRRMLDEAGLPDVKIVASNELDEFTIESIRKEQGCIDVYGVGTRLVTADGEGGGALGGVYKLVELDGRPRIKVSADRAKSTIPGRKRLWRVSSRQKGKRFEMDVLSSAGETPGPGDKVVDPSNPMRHARIPEGSQVDDLRSVVLRDGARTRPAPSLQSVAERCHARLSLLPDGCRRLLNPHRYRVAQTRHLSEVRDRMIEAASPAASGAAEEEVKDDRSG